MKKARLIKSKLLLFSLLLMVMMNVVAYFHAYKFTHFASENITKTKEDGLSFVQKIQAIAFGINNPRPQNTTVPSQPYEIVKIKSNKALECWFIKNDTTKGTVIIFHGFSGQKSSMLDKSDEFLKLGYSTLLVDFMGSGGSEGNQTTIGFKEAEEVRSCFDYLKEKGESNICLFGTSMGAVAIMKAVSDYKIEPNSVILECPFGSMYQTVAARFSSMNVPSFPMAGLLVFWGGVQNGFWAFDHNPIEYAKQINCPTLLLYGGMDTKVSSAEINQIYTNLPAQKSLIVFPNAGHENYLKEYKKEWVIAVNSFLQ